MWPSVESGSPAACGVEVVSGARVSGIIYIERVICEVGVMVCFMGHLTKCGP